MRKSISIYVRRIAGYIEVDETPTEDEIRNNRVNGESNTVTESPNKSEVDKKPVVNSIISPKEEKLEKTQRPRIKPPRRQTETSKKWNENSKTEKMRDYMKEYRQEKIFDTGGAKNVYRKKSKNC